MKIRRFLRMALVHGVRLTRCLFFLFVLIGAGWVQAQSLTPDNRTLTTFFAAIEQDNLGTVSRLLQQGMSPNVTNEQGNPALFMALRANADRVAGYLLQQPGIAIDHHNPLDETPLMMAAMNGQLQVAKDLIARGAAINKPGWAPLHYAVVRGYENMVELLLSHGAQLNALSPNGTTALMMASQFGFKRVVQQLVTAGADITLRNQRGLNAVDLAERLGEPDIAAYLKAACQAKQATCSQPTP